MDSQPTTLLNNTASTIRREPIGVDQSQPTDRNQAIGIDQSEPTHLNRLIGIDVSLWRQVYRNYKVLIEHTADMLPPVVQILLLQTPIWMLTFALLSSSVTYMDFNSNR